MTKVRNNDHSSLVVYEISKRAKDLLQPNKREMPKSMNGGFPAEVVVFILYCRIIHSLSKTSS